MKDRGVKDHSGMAEKADLFEPLKKISLGDFEAEQPSADSKNEHG